MPPLPRNDALPPPVWSEAHWDRLERAVRERALAAGSDAAAWRVLRRASHRVMRRFTTSFFLVSRFLPRPKRDRVELIYAAVRYPDEVVDAFPLDAAARDARLDRWDRAYATAWECGGVREMLRAEVPAFLAGFVALAREAGVPRSHYEAFLAAMRRDVRPRPFATFEDLVDEYVHGSAVVVGYFLAYVYGASAPGVFDRALEASRRLGVALQTTNFLRDVPEDERRGRIYIPLDLLRRAGVEPPLTEDAAKRGRVFEAMAEMARIAREDYAFARANLDAFAPDCRTAIRACIDVYGRLNARIAEGAECLARRQSVPGREKWAALPPEKYWRLPLALIGR